MTTTDANPDQQQTEWLIEHVAVDMCELTARHGATEAEQVIRATNDGDGFTKDGPSFHGELPDGNWLRYEGLTLAPSDLDRAISAGLKMAGR